MANNLIIVDPDIMLGKPVIVGTRVTVELILEKLAAGETIEQILEDFPQITRDGILAALAFASDALKNVTTYPTGVTTE